MGPLLPTLSRPAEESPRRRTLWRQPLGAVSTARHSPPPVSPHRPPPHPPAASPPKNMRLPPMKRERRQEEAGGQISPPVSKPTMRVARGPATAVWLAVGA